MGAMHYRMRGANFATVVDLAPAYMQLPIKEADKHKTAFRDANGRLWEFNVCGFGLKTVPAAFSARLDDDLNPVLQKGVEKWLDDLLLHSKTLDEHLVLIKEVLLLLSRGGYSVHFYKCKWCFPELEFLGVMVGRAGIRPSPAKTEALAQLAQPTTVAEVRAFLGLAGFLRDFVPDFSAIVAPITDILRSKEFNTRKARNKQIPWGSEQTQAMAKVIE